MGRQRLSWLERHEGSGTRRTHLHPTLGGVGRPFKGQIPVPMHPERIPKRAHTCFANNRLIEDVVGPEDAWINPADAETKGVKTGDVIEIFNDRGRARFKAFVTNRIVQGNINVAHGKYAQWNEQGVEMGGEGNVLTKQEFTGTVAKMGILTMWLSAPLGERRWLTLLRSLMPTLLPRKRILGRSITRSKSTEPSKE